MACPSNSFGVPTSPILNKDRPLVDRDTPKNGVGWFVNAQQGKDCSLTNDSPTAHPQWAVVEARPLRGVGNQSSGASIAITPSKHGRPC